MKFQRTDILLSVLVLMGALAGQGAWAATGSCIYTSGAHTEGAGIGGTGIKSKGTGGAALSAEAGTLAGNVLSSEGKVEARSNGRSRLLAQGGPVCVGETIVTSRAGSAQIKMADGELITVRPQTELKIERFVYDGTKDDGILLALFKGASRIVTGIIGQQHPQNDLVRTTTVTVGVRGTDHEVVVIPARSGQGYAAGTYDKVNSGVTFIKSAGGEIDIHPNQVGYAANAADLPVLLKEMPEFFNANPSVRYDGGSSEAGGKSKDAGEGRTSAGESAEKPNGMGRPESMAHPERSEIQAHPERPELPSHPERPELPSRPEMPELPSHPELPELPSTPEVPAGTEGQ